MTSAGLQLDIYDLIKEAAEYTLSVSTEGAAGNMLSGPVSTQYSEPISVETYLELDLDGIGDISCIYAAITSVKFSDGSTYEVQEKDWTYECWKIRE